MSIFESLLSPISDLAGKLIDGKISKRELAHELATLSEKQAQEISLAQIEVNKLEAKGSWFQSGWRPATGWICVAGFAMNFLIAPLGNFMAALLGSPVMIPMIDLSTMMPVLLGMLGLGGLRTYEKINK